MSTLLCSGVATTSLKRAVFSSSPSWFASDRKKKKQSSTGWQRRCRGDEDEVKPPRDVLKCDAGGEGQPGGGDGLDSACLLPLVAERVGHTESVIGFQVDKHGVWLPRAEPTDANSPFNRPDNAVMGLLSFFSPSIPLCLEVIPALRTGERGSSV